MRLYLMRHGIAAPADDPSVQKDSERPLTAKGIKRMRRIAQGLWRLKIPFDGILTSPLLRARQTADVVADALDMESRVEEISALAPAGTAEHLLLSLGSYQDRRHLLLVGHEPLLRRCAVHLLAGHRGSGPILEFKKGTVCCIEIDTLSAGAPARLLWLLTPKQLRLLGRS
jgi:phosphohistidine phosphatase